MRIRQRAAAVLVLAFRVILTETLNNPVACGTRFRLTGKLQPRINPFCPCLEMLRLLSTRSTPEFSSCICWNTLSRLQRLPIESISDVAPEIREVRSPFFRASLVHGSQHIMQASACSTIMYGVHMCEVRKYRSQLQRTWIKHGVLL